MSYSDIDICNLALHSLGEDAIQSFNENNKRSRMCNSFYKSSSNLILTKFDWPFARRYKNLNQVIVPEDEIPFGTHAYQLPSNCLTPRELAPLGSRDKWEVIGPHLFCEQATAGLYYTCDDTPITAVSDTFANLVALLLAIRLGPAITQDKSLIDVLQKRYGVEQAEAWESDANIGNTYREYDEDPNNDTFVTSGGNGNAGIPSIIT